MTTRPASASVPAPRSTLEKLANVSSLVSGSYAIILLLIMLIGWGVRVEIMLAHQDWQQQETAKQVLSGEQRQNSEEAAIEQINVHLADIEGDIKALVAAQKGR